MIKIIFILYEQERIFMAGKIPQIIQDEAGNPIFAVIDYQEYLRMIDELEDPEGIKRDLEEAFAPENQGPGKPLEQILQEIEQEEKQEHLEKPGSQLTEINLRPLSGQISLKNIFPTRLYKERILF